MSDLVKRLRYEHAELANPREEWMFLVEAADRIDELEEMYMELKRLRKQEALDNLALQRKYEALVDEITGRSLYRPDGLICFDPNELRALLEDDDE